jgi:hypothetical protein
VGTKEKFLKKINNSKILKEMSFLKVCSISHLLVPPAPQRYKLPGKPDSLLPPKDNHAFISLGFLQIAER